MKRLILLALALIGATAIVQAGPDGDGEAGETTLLFVQQAETASFDGTTLTLTGVPSTVWFSDRPERRAGHIDSETYASAWQPGKTFADDPPNAAIAIESGDQQEVVVVTLNGVEREGDGTFQYDVSIISGELPAEADNVALLIDSLAGDIATCVFLKPC